MKKRSLLLMLSIAAALTLRAQEGAVPDLAQINIAAKNQYVKTETLDMLRQQLNYFDGHPAIGNEQQQLLIETYRAVVNAYSMNNHFKQGYGVYQKYLYLKEKKLSSEKTEAIAKANINIEEQQRKDLNELTELQNHVKQLDEGNELLLSKRKAFRHYFSIGIIALTVIFAFLLLQAGLKLNKLNHDLKAGRERLKIIHRIAVLGHLKQGTVSTINTVFNSLKVLSAENSKLLDEMNKVSDEKNTELANLRKRYNELSRLTDQ